MDQTRLQCSVGRCLAESLKPAFSRSSRHPAGTEQRSQRICVSWLVGWASQHSTVWETASVSLEIHQQPNNETRSSTSTILRSRSLPTRRAHSIGGSLKTKGRATSQRPPLKKPEHGPSCLLSGSCCNNAPAQHAELPHLRADEKRLAAAPLLRVSLSIKQPFIPWLEPRLWMQAWKKSIFKKNYNFMLEKTILSSLSYFSLLNWKMNHHHPQGKSFEANFLSFC